MQRMACCAALLLFVAGCGNPNAKDLSRDPGIPTWDGLTAIKQQDLLQPIIMGAQMGNIAGVKEAVGKQKFLDAFAKFESEPIPSKWATPEREAARTDIIKHFKALIDGAKSGASDTDLKASAEAANKAINAISQPNPAPAAK